MGVPVPEILEVGHEIISLPYMLQQKMEGEEAVNHPDRLNILQKLGTICPHDPFNTNDWFWKSI